MSQKPCANSNPLRPAFGRLSLLGVFVLAGVAFGNMACEDKAIGRPCDVLTDAGTEQAVYNSEALECPSRICLKPAYQSGASKASATGAFCSAPCSQDSDCDPNQLRDTTNQNDHRCKSGFACGIAFVKGPICCQKLCLCRDFLGTNGTAIPIACQSGAAACD